MVFDNVAACKDAIQGSGPSGFFVALVLVFASYILVDSIVAASVIHTAFKRMSG
jgi:hypothetical protein